MKKLLAVSLIALAFGCSASAADYKAAAPHSYSGDAPKLVDRFPSVNKSAYQVPVYTGPVAKDIANKRHSMRTRLREALKAGPNFAGHYAIAIYGCGTGCIGLTMVDVKNGQIYDNIPASVTEYYVGDKDHHLTERDFAFSKDSTLLYLTGSLEGYGSGSFLFNFRNGQFNLIKHSPVIQYIHPENY